MELLHRIRSGGAPDWRGEIARGAYCIYAAALPIGLHET